MATPNIAVIGLGNWGTALANHLASLGHTVLAWTRDSAVSEAINRDRRHPLVLREVCLSSNVIATSDLSLCSQAHFIVYVLPSSSLGQVLPQLAIAPGATFVSAVKGLEATTHFTPLQYLAHVKGPEVKSVVLSGPSFALDIINQRPCGLVAGSVDSNAAKAVAELFSGNSMRVYTSTDPVGVELGSVVKNVVALAVGVCDGLELGESARAGLITRGLAEMTRLAEALGAERTTLSGLSGLGDLVLTATSALSRNRTVGYRLGRGESLSTIISTIGSVAESVKTTPLVVRLAESHGVDMPICKQVESLLCGKSKITDLVQNLLNRPLRGE